MEVLPSSLEAPASLLLEDKPPLLVEADPLLPTYFLTLATCVAGAFPCIVFLIAAWVCSLRGPLGPLVALTTILLSTWDLITMVCLCVFWIVHVCDEFVC